MIIYRSLAAAAMIAGSMLFSHSSQALTVTGEQVDMVGPGATVIGNTEVRAALGGREAIEYFIPNTPLELILRFSGVVPTLPGTLNILFEDLDLAGANDPVGFLETVQVLDAGGGALTGVISDIASLLVDGNSDTQQLLSLGLGILGVDPFFLRLSFTSNIGPGGGNTAEYLIADVSQVPLPAALPLLATGFAVFGFMGWRRKRRDG